MLMSTLKHGGSIVAVVVRDSSLVARDGLQTIPLFASKTRWATNACSTTTLVGSVSIQIFLNVGPFNEVALFGLFVSVALIASAIDHMMETSTCVHHLRLVKFCYSPADMMFWFLPLCSLAGSSLHLVSNWWHEMESILLLVLSLALVFKWYFYIVLGSSPVIMVIFGISWEEHF